MKPDNNQRRGLFDKPCAKCPYKLGMIKTFINPCPQCKENGYSFYERITQEGYQDKDFDNNDK